MQARWTWVGLAVGLTLLATSAFAAAPQSPGVIAYPSSFFATMGVNTAYDMVVRIPGFAFDDGSAVRGFAGAAGNVLIDGARPASKTADLQTILQRIPSSDVERIDLIRGGAPGIDMQGKTVVANVIRKKGKGFSGAAQVWEYAPANVGIVDPGAELDGAWRWNGKTFQGSLYAFRGHDDTHGDGPHLVLGPQGQVLDRSNLREAEPNWNYLATSVYEAPLLAGKFRLNFTLQDQPGDVSATDHFLVAGRQAERDRLDRTDVELGAQFSRTLSRKLSFELFGLQHFDNSSSTSTFATAIDAQVFSLSDPGGESIARGVLHWRPSSTLQVDAGGEYAFNWLKTRTRFTDNGAPIDVPAADVRVQEARGEAFATATWRATPRLTLEAGVRVEESTITSAGDVTLTKTLTYPKPRVVLTWAPDAVDQVRLRVEREVGQLDFNSFAANAALNGNGVVAGNPNLTPQRDWAFEAVWDRHFWKDGDLSLTVLHLRLEDVIDRAPVFSSSGVFDEPANIGGGSENDLIAAFSVPLRRFGLAGGTFWGSGTWRFSKVSDPTTGEMRPISGQHPLDAQLKFSNDVPRLKLSWGASSTLGTLERNFRFDEIDTSRFATVTNVFVEYKPRPDLAIRAFAETSIEVDDLTRQVFAGPRNTSSLAFTDVQGRRFGILSYLRVRKTFN